MLSRTVIRDVVVPIRVPRLKLSRQLERRRGETVFVDYLSFTLVEGIVEGYGDTRLRNVAQLFVDAIPELGFSESDRGFVRIHSQW